MPVFQGGFNTYGFSLGILVLEAYYPRVPGDLGNATSFQYPVILRPIPGATPRRVVDGDPSLLESFVQGARDLEDQGVRAITTSCGFLAVFQQQMAAAVRIPVFTSSLIQVPLVQTMLGPDGRVGILTADATCLTEEHFTGVGWSSKDVPIAVHGMEKYPNFTSAIMAGGKTLDFEAVRAEMLDACLALLRQHPDVGALVLECTNMVPYAASLQQLTGMPVFDIITYADMVHASLHRSETVPSSMARL